MELSDKLSELANKIKQQGSSIKTEEATKNAFIMPFLHNILGYDVFNPSEVLPEFICDVGTKKGEKIDYAIFHGGEIQILFECKKFGEILNTNHASQLFRYFHATKARIAVLSNGQHYWFFTDLDEKNKMDQKPFMTLDLLNIDSYSVPEIEKLSKSSFNIESVVNSAEELKYVSQIKREIAHQFLEPKDDFIRFYTQKVYDGTITARVRDQFSRLVKKATAQFLNDQVNERLKSAMSNAERPDRQSVEPVDEIRNDSISSNIDTTSEEIESFYLVKSILRGHIDVKRIHYRDNQTYFSILFDNNNRKTICRMYFNGTKRQIGVFCKEKKETRHAIDALDDIFLRSEEFRATANFFKGNT